MAQPDAPTSPRRDAIFVEPRTGRLSDQGLQLLEQYWRQLAAGFVTVPVTIEGTDILTLTPIMAAEGAASYGDFMAWAGVAPNLSTGAMTAFLTAGGAALETVKVYKSPGLVQAGAGDVVAGGFYVFFYSSALDGGAGGLILK